MKTDKKDGPDLSSIIDNLPFDTRNDIQDTKTAAPREEIAAQKYTSDEYGGRLWEEFKECLLDPEEDTSISRTKLYAIDDDIVETLHQCDFGKPNVHVINSILRTFLIDNIPRLREMHRPRSVSLLDKFN